MWRRNDPEEDAQSKGGSSTAFLKTAWTAFVIIFLAEWGDLTQLATATLAAKYHSPFTLFAAATLALWASSGVAIAVGSQLKHLINPSTLKKVAAVAFAGVALWMFIAEARAGC
jgi:putative Ca2+/H+ antiporter (TMEM165/GDT1 family)